jgi:AraC family transcriptional regulator, regulatory protein of adaptative response / DNA-3-methyladenine glycosylase II
MAKNIKCHAKISSETIERKFESGRTILFDEKMCSPGRSISKNQPGQNPQWLLPGKNTKNHPRHSHADSQQMKGSGQWFGMLAQVVRIKVLKTLIFCVHFLIEPEVLNENKEGRDDSDDHVRKQPVKCENLHYIGRMKQNEIFYQAMLARDPRFDGKFFVGVKTTGIYCRPICPAKPKKENVEFFSNHLRAEKAGYRPCLRCRPESAPMSPAWFGKSAIVQRAIRVLYHQEPIEFSEDRFASQFGVSARHLRRLFIEEIGKTPKQISFENRLNLSRKLISETHLPITDVAFASGFLSIRRFNDAFKDRFKKTPSGIRRSKITGAPNLCLSIAYRPPFDFQGLLQTYQNHRVGRLEWAEGDRWCRIVHFHGKTGRIWIRDDAKNSSLRLEIDFPDTRAIPNLISRVRNQFDLDSDPVLIANSLEVDPRISKLLKATPGIRLPSGWDPFEVAIGTILGQLVSVEQGRQMVSDLIDLCGEDSGLQTPEGHTIRLFPTAEAISKADLSSLKTTTTRKKALVGLCRALMEKKISLVPTQDVNQFIEQIQEISGIGPWTAHYIALRALRHTDSFPHTDLILARALEKYSKQKIEQMSPWRGYVAALFWRHLYKPSAKQRKTS